MFPYVNILHFFFTSGNAFTRSNNASFINNKKYQTNVTYKTTYVILCIKYYIKEITNEPKRFLFDSYLHFYTLQKLTIV